MTAGYEATSCYLPYLASLDVSPRAMSENIALDLTGSHKTAEPTGVGAPVLDRGTVSVSPLLPETCFRASASKSVSGSEVSRPSLIASAVAMQKFQYRIGLRIVAGDAAFLATAASISRCRSTRPRSPRGSALRLPTQPK